VHIAATFPEFIDTLPEWEQQLLQFATLRHPPFALLNQLSNPAGDSILAVSDGSHVHDRIAFGWTIRNHAGLEVACSHGPGWGQGSSHRAEGYGFLSVVLFITRITEFCMWQQPLSFQFFSDNNGLLSRVKQRVSYGDILYPNETLRPDWDIVEQIASFIQSSIHTITIDHVKGHQDDDKAYEELSPEAQMNVDADELAGEYIHEHFSPRPQAPMLPTTRCQLILRGTTVTSHYNTTIIRSASSTTYLSKLYEDKDWDLSTQSQLHWPTFRSLIRRNTFRNVWMVKLVHDLLPFKSTTAKYSGSDDTFCPYCQASPDTFIHWLRCDHPDRSTWRNLLRPALKPLERKHRLRPGILTFMTTQLEAWMTSTPAAPCPTGFQSIYTSQLKIGWENLFRGFASTEWLRAQHEYTTTMNLNRSHNPDSWLPTVLATLVDLLYQGWIDHNQKIYGKDKAEANLFERQNLERELRSLHTYRLRVLSDDRDKLFINDIPHFLNTVTTAQLFNWLSIHKPAIHESVRTAQSESVAGSRPLSSYFPITRPGSTTRTRYNSTLHKNTRTQGRRPSVRLRHATLHSHHRTFPFVPSITRFFSRTSSTST
jgi:hypothetical protein